MNNFKNSDFLKNRLIPTFLLAFCFIFVLIVFRLSFFNAQNWSSYSFLSIRIVSILIYFILAFLAFYELSKAFVEYKIYSFLLTLIICVNLFLGPDYFRFLFYQIKLNNFSYEKLFNLLYSDIFLYLLILFDICIFILIRLITIKNINYKYLFLKAVVFGVFIFILTIFWKTFIFLNTQKSGLIYNIGIVLITSCSDTGGYLAGNFLPKTFLPQKIAPGISPNKTWRGLLGSVIFSIFAAFIFIICSHFIDSYSKVDSFSWFNILFGLEEKNTFQTKISIILFTFTIPFIATIGDLLFSMIKRWTGIKDFSKIFKGHGGFLDRLDSISVVYFIFSLIALNFV
ncbi:phosphatidate cytidylyltransferase [Mycoplasmopsis cricetuli]|uniref:phosphatidate cytidylyltransferase n=1 Tax=Mycoplasmopsis cricetuli TaxID=171283 RepID=UPI00046FECDC|nr:phosphatidate cytidylyltransferase [Mycoplasmopsis cricetuli]